MSRGVKALVVVLCVLLVLSLDVNFLLLRNRKECSQQVVQPSVAESSVTEKTDVPAESQNSQIASELPVKKEEVEEAPKKDDSGFKLDEEIIIRYFYFMDSDSLSISFQNNCNLGNAVVEIEPAVKNLSVRHYGRDIEVSGDFVPGTLYSVVVKDGDRSAGIIVTAPDHSKRLRFQTFGTLFPLYNDYWNLPVSVENLDGKLTAKVYQAYSARELEFIKRPEGSDYSKVIFETVIPTKNIRNKEQEISLNLDGIGIPRKPGLYRIELSDDESCFYYSTRTLIVTDLGVVATYADEEVAVAVRSLKDGSPVANARVQIFSQKLWEYYHADTDENGFCRLPISDASEKEDSLAYLVVTKGDDRVYADLERSVRVKSASKAAVFPERGICRPGESMRVFASLRDKDLRAQGGVPMAFQLTDPRGNIIAKDVVSGDGMGFYEYDCKIPQNGFTGSYSLMVYPPVKEKDETFGPYGLTYFLVGEYVPDQIKLSLDATLDADGAAIDCTGKSEYYFGMPVADTRVTLTAEAERGRFTPKGYEDYSFGCYENTWGGRIASVGVQTNDDGSFEGTLDVSECVEQIATPVRYYVEATSLPNAGGRSVSTHQVLQKDYAEYYVGALKNDDEEAKECVIGIVGVTPDGSIVALEDKELKYSLKRYDWDFVLKRSVAGFYERTWQRNEETVVEDKLVLEDGKLLFGKEIGRGEFKLEIRNSNDIVLCSFSFWHWGGESGARLKDPNNLVFKLDKENYLPGETALVTFDSPMEGSGIVMAGLNRLAEPIAFAAKAGRNEIAVPIPADLNAGSWFALVAVACRKDTASDPILLKGMVSLDVRQDSHRLKVTVETPDESRPSADMEVCVRLADSNGAPVAGEAILWGVDMGILSLTNYEVPDIFAFFFGKAINPLVVGDNYKMLYPVVNAGTEKIGGGYSMDAAKFRGGMRERLAAPAIFHLGIVKTDESGVAKAMVRLPEHTGVLNVMALAADSERTGSGASEVILRRETSLLLTVPRVVAPGDEFQITVQGFNHTLEKGDALWNATIDGDGSMEVSSGDFLLDKGGSVAKTIRVKAGAREGRLSFKFTMTLGGVEAVAEGNVVVRHAMPMTSTFETVEIAPGESKEIAVGEYGDIEIGSAALAVTGSLKWLASYPYGCLEQVTATAMPLLSIQSLVDCGAVPASYALGAKNNILRSLADLSTKRKWNGWLSMWGGDQSVWTEGSLFAYLFLFEADKAGYSLDATWRGRIVKNLREYLNTTSNSVANRVFANYLLAYAEPQTAVKYLKILPDGKTEIPEDADEKIQEVLLQRQCDGFCKFLIAMTRIKGGHAAEGVKELEKLLQEDFLKGHAEFIGFDSIIRREGIALWMLCDVLPEHPAVEKIYKSLISHRNSEGHWGTTQDNAWAALGLSRYCAVRKIGRISGTVVKGGAETAFTTAVRYEGANSIVVKNTGDAAITAFVRDRKVPEKLKKVENGFYLYKVITDMEGNPIKEFKRGQLVCVSLNVRFDSDMIGDYVICDLLPGCLEIEDDNLATRSRSAVAAVNNRLPLNYRELRYDRFLGFGFSGCKLPTTMEITYCARVVSTGDFAIPPVMVESMYHPELKAMTPYDCERMVAE